MMDLIISRQFR